LERARRGGFDEGWRKGKSQAEYEAGADRVADRLAKLQQQVDEFQTVSGVNLSEPWRWGDIATLIKTIDGWARFPDAVVRDLERSAKDYARQGKALGEIAGQVRDLFSGAGYSQEAT
jgi:hypothetical protein